MQAHKSLASAIAFIAAWVLLACAGAPAAFADSVTYQVSVNTSSDLAGSGFIDLQLNPGTMTTQPVNANVVGFQSNGVLNPADPNNGTTGAVTGTLPGPVTISNTTSTNEYTEAITFGTFINFDLTLSGPGVNSAGQAGGASGSTFVLDFFDSNGNYLFVNNPDDPNGFAAGLVQISAQGLVSTQTNPGPNNTPPVVTFTPAPEPATFGAGAVAAFLLLVSVARKRNRNVAHEVGLH